MTVSLDVTQELIEPADAGIGVAPVAEDGSIVGIERLVIHHLTVVAPRLGPVHVLKKVGHTIGKPRFVAKDG